MLDPHLLIELGSLLLGKDSIPHEKVLLSKVNFLLSKLVILEFKERLQFSYAKLLRLDSFLILPYLSFIES